MPEPQALQFDRPEFQPGAAAAAVTCTSCKQPVVQSYYEANGQLICSHCREQLTLGGGGSQLGRLLRACVYGLGVALAGGVVWWAVRYFLKFEVGLISIAIGYGVGVVVRRASGNRGGRAYQVLAVLLTYAGICSNYVPDVVEELMHSARQEAKATAGTPQATVSTAPATTAAVTPAKAAAITSAKAGKTESELTFGGFLMAIGVVFAIALAAPVLGGFENIIGLLIIAFGLWEAWKINQRRTLAINGPFSVAPAAGNV